MTDRQLAKNILRAFEEIVVDADRGRRRISVGRVDLDLHVRGADELPRGLGRLLALLADAEQQEVGDDLGTGHAAERAAGQAHRSDEVGAIRHCLSGVRSGLVGGKATREQADVSAWSREVQRLEDEVVVNGELAGVVRVIPELDVPERHVADRCDERIVGHGGVREGLVTHLRARVERGRDARRQRVEFDTDHLRIRWRVSEERAAP